MPVNFEAEVIADEATAKWLTAHPEAVPEVIRREHNAKEFDPNKEAEIWAKQLPDK